MILTEGISFIIDVIIPYLTCLIHVCACGLDRFIKIII